MKNIEKVMDALEKAFPVHCVEMLYVPEVKIYKIYIDGEYVGHFTKEFFEDDIENREIAIEIVAPVKSIKEFIEECEGSGCVGDVIRAVERGFKKWEKESQRNN